MRHLIFLAVSCVAFLGVPLNGQVCDSVPNQSYAPGYPGQQATQTACDDLPFSRPMQSVMPPQPCAQSPNPFSTPVPCRPSRTSPSCNCASCQSREIHIQIPAEELEDDGNRDLESGEAPPEVASIPNQPGAFVAPPRQGRIQEAGRSMGIRGLAITIPRIRLELPSIELPSLTRFTNRRSMQLEAANAPYMVAPASYQRPMMSTPSIRSQETGTAPQGSRRDTEAGLADSIAEIKKLKDELKAKHKALDERNRAVDQMLLQLRSQLTTQLIVQPHCPTPTLHQQPAPPAIIPNVPSPTPPRHAIPTQNMRMTPGPTRLPDCDTMPAYSPAAYPTAPQYIQEQMPAPRGPGPQPAEPIQQRKTRLPSSPAIERSPPRVEELPYPMGFQGDHPSRQFSSSRQYPLSTLGQALRLTQIPHDNRQTIVSQVSSESNSRSASRRRDSNIQNAYYLGE